MNQCQLSLDHIASRRVLLKRVVRLVILFITFQLPALADEWVPPSVNVVTSANGIFKLEVRPKPFQGALAYFKDKEGGKPNPGAAEGQQQSSASATLSQAVGKEFREIWKGPLSNEIAPVTALVSDDGQFVVTLDNWHTMGYGDNVVAVHGSHGEVLYRKSLDQVFSQSEIKAFSHSVSSIWWRRGEWIDPSNNLILVGAPGPFIRLRLKDGQRQSADDSDIIAGLRSPSSAVCEVAAGLACEKPLPGGQADLIRLLAPPEPIAVRVRAAVALHLLGDSQGDDLLIETASAPGDPRLRAHVIEELPRLGSRAEPILKRLTKDPDGTIVMEATAALSKLGTSGIDALLVSLDSPGTADERGGAANALGASGEQRAIPHLLKAIADSDNYVANAASNAAIKLGGSSIAPDLLKLLRTGTTEDARLCMYFGEVRYPASIPVLVTVLQRQPGKRDGFLHAVASQALLFQTGTDLGQDPSPWKAWVQRWKPESYASVAESNFQRGRLMVELGDGGGLLWLGDAIQRNPSEPRYRAELRKALTRVPGLVSMGGSGSSLGLGGSNAAFRRADGAVLICAQGRRATLEVFSRSNRLVGSYILPDSLGGRFTFSADGSSMAINDMRGMAQVVDTSNGQQSPPFTPPGNSFEIQYALSATGRQMVTFGRDMAALVWNTRTGKMISQVYEGGEAAVLNHDGSRLAIAKAGHVTVYRCPEATPVTPPLVFKQPLRLLAFLEGFRLLAGNQVWNAQGKPAAPALPFPPGEITGWTVSPDGRRLSVAVGRLVTTFDLSSSRPVGPGLQRPAPIHGIALDEHGQRVAITCEDGTLTVWDTNHGSRIASPIRPRYERFGGYESPIFSPDGRRLMASTQRYTAVWRLDLPDKLPSTTSELEQWHREPSQWLDD